MADLLVRCFCGKFEGEASGVSPTAGTHVTCYCDDCQTFQHYLGQADRVLTANGGTEVYQMSPAGFRIRAGREHLACLRLSPNGIARWYASCCNAPIGNTPPTPGLPFLGVITTCFDKSIGDDAIEGALGPLKKGICAKHAVGDKEELNASDGVPVSLYFSFMSRILRLRLKGDHKRSPFFDSRTGELIVEPRVLTKDERNAARPGANQND